MTADPIRRLRATDPYRPGTPLPDHLAADTVLLEIERRMHMETTTSLEDRRREQRPPQRTGLVVAAAAFAIVVTVVGAVALISGDQSSNDVAATSSSIDTVHGFVDAVSSGQTDLSGYLADDAVYIRVQTWPIAGDLAEYWAALDTEMTVDDCQVDGTIVTCEGVHTNAIYRTLDRQFDGSWTFVLEDGRISSFLEDYGEDDFSMTADPLAGPVMPIEDFIAWLHLTHPEWLEEADTGIVYAMGRITTLPEVLLMLNGHNGELLMSYLPEYREAVEAVGGLPEDWELERWGPLPRTPDDGDAGAFRLVTGFAAAVSEGDTDLSGFVTSDATYAHLAVSHPIDEDLAGYWATLETRLAFGECELAAQLVTCDSHHQNAIYDAIGFENTGTWTFVVQGGLIVQAVETLDLGPVSADYIAWLLARHPEWIESTDFVQGDGPPTSGGIPEPFHERYIRLTAENASVLLEHLDEYAIDFAAVGGLPEDWDPFGFRWGEPILPEA